MTEQTASKYKWLVALAGSLIIMMTIGVSRSIVVFLDDIKLHYDLTEKQKALFIVLPNVAGGLSAPITAILCKKYSVRWITISCSLAGFFAFFYANYFEVSYTVYCVL